MPTGTKPFSAPVTRGKQAPAPGAWCQPYVILLQCKAFNDCWQRHCRGGGLSCASPAPRARAGAQLSWRNSKGPDGRTCSRARGREQGPPSTAWAEPRRQELWVVNFTNIFLKLRIAQQTTTHMHIKTLKWYLTSKWHILLAETQETSTHDWEACRLLLFFFFCLAMQLVGS